MLLDFPPGERCSWMQAPLESRLVSSPESTRGKGRAA